MTNLIYFFRGFWQRDIDGLTSQNEATPFTQRKALKFEIFHFAFDVSSKTKIYKFSRIEERNYAHKDGNMWAGIILYFEQRFVNCLARLFLQPFSFDKTRKTCMYLIV